MSVASPLAPNRRRRVLHVGCGHPAPHRLHAVFAPEGWDEIRLDIDPKVRPDIVCSTVDLSAVVPTGSVDAIWSSHTIEHLHDREAARALTEFRRVLAATGFVLIRCPDVEAVMRCFLDKGPDHVAYRSAAGPITPLDMLFGHRGSVEGGNLFMSHRTAFTDRRMGSMLLDAGFGEVRTCTGATYDLWAVAFAPRADIPACLRDLAATGLAFEP